MEESGARSVDVPAGWYPDPQGQGRLRYWNGTAWTEHVSPADDQPVGSAATTPVPGPAPKRRRSGLKTALAVLGGLFVLLVIAIGSCAVPLLTQGPKLGEESHAYAERVLSEVVTTWDQEALEGELSPEFREVTSDAELTKLFALFRRLGDLESLGEPEGDLNVSKSVGQETLIRAVWVFEAEFENGPAEITLFLIKHGSTWQVAGFYVDSELFLEELQ